MTSYTAPLSRAHSAAPLCPITAATDATTSCPTLGAQVATSTSASTACCRTRAPIATAYCFVTPRAAALPVPTATPGSHVPTATGPTVNVQAARHQQMEWHFTMTETATASDRWQTYHRRRLTRRSGQYIPPGCLRMPVIINVTVTSPLTRTCTDTQASTECGQRDSALTRGRDSDCQPASEWHRRRRSRTVGPARGPRQATGTQSGLPP